MTTQTNPNVRTVSLGALKRNFLALRDCLPENTRLLAVLKADAYGHGLCETAGVLATCGADMFGVAIADEGAALRACGIATPVLVLGAAAGEAIHQAIRNDLTLTVCTPACVKEIERACCACGLDAKVHVKLDTGMNRIGCRDAGELIAVMDAVLHAPHVSLTGAFTHLAAADGDEAYTQQQLKRLREMTALLPRGIVVHCANSAAIHSLPEAAMDMARAGISLYGYPPVETDIRLEMCMTWETVVVHVKEIQPGECIGYGCTFTARHPMKVATIACGYGDGYHRAASNRGEVLIDGRRCPIIGRICMDQMMVDVTALERVAPGDRVVLMGQMGDACITAEDIAVWADTIPYEILLSTSGRVRRIFVD